MEMIRLSQKPKKKSPTDQYIFQRRVFEPTGSFGHDESPYAVLGQSDSKEESEKVMLGADEGGKGKDQAGPDAGAQAKGHTGSDAGDQDEGQARSNPDEISEGQAGPDPGNARADVHSIPSLVVHTGSDREHMDLDVADVSPQSTTEQLNKGFTATAYPKVQKNLKLTVKEQVLLEEPASSSGTLSSLQHLSRDISFGDLFFSDKPSDADKNAETEVESMVNVPIQQALSSISLMTSTIIDLTSRPESPKLFEALEKSMNRDHSEELAQDLVKARKKKEKSRESPKTPPGSPPSPSPPAGPFGASRAPGDSGLSHVPPPPPPSLSTNQEKRHATPEPAWSIRSSDVPVPTNNWASALASNYSPPPEDSLLAQTGDITTFMDWFCKRRGITELKPQDLEGHAYEIIKVFHPDVIHLQCQMEECHKLLTDSVDDPILRHNVSKPLPLGSPPGQVTIQSDFFFNKYLEYLRYGSKGRRPALSISKIKVAYYPDAGLEQMCQIIFGLMRSANTILLQCMVSLTGGSKDNDSTLIDTHLKKIVLRRANLNEHVIAERDFKYIYPSDFEDLYLLNLQGHLNHLLPKDTKILTTTVNQWTRYLVIRQRVEDFQLGIESYQTQLNLTKPQWDATGFEYKHDYSVIDSSKAVMFQNTYGVQMMMRFNDIHKFSDGTLQQIDEALDYMVKVFRINRMNPGLNTRFWTRKDVDRCKAFMFSIQRRLRTRRIFRNLESFIGGPVREGDYRLLKRTE
uniref:Uncharacterized protein n=1 Tax=Tanacetum cinerariifolium TaxID=118510 RepID=A0A6L2JYU2_TANCI|nr:hypothetical protein [Tanacetum cinerariifolium]